MNDFPAALLAKVGLLPLAADGVLDHFDSYSRRREGITPRGLHRHHDLAFTSSSSIFVRKLEERRNPLFGRAIDLSVESWLFFPSRWLRMFGNANDLKAVCSHPRQLRRAPSVIKKWVARNVSSLPSVGCASVGATTADCHRASAPSGVQRLLQRNSRGVDNLRILRNYLRIVRRTATLERLFPSVRQGVLAATLTQPEKWWYLSELAEFLGTRPSSLQRELAALVDIGILERRREGTRAYFKAEKRSPIFRDLQSIFEKTAGIAAVLSKLLQPFRKKITCSFVYGSIARSEEHGASDIDLMVIGKVGLADLVPALRAAEKRLNREVNVTNYSVDEFRDKIAHGDHFLTTVLKRPKQFIQGSESELEEIARQ